MCSIVALLLVLLVFFVFLNKKEYFFNSSEYQSVPEYYMHKDMKPFGYGYRPYYGYNTYMYSNTNNVSYSRPLFVPIYDYNYDINKTYSFPFRLYGMY